jgi:hypothetical protein
MVIQMHIDATVLCQQFVQQHHRLVEPLQVRLHPSPPSVAVRLLLDDARLLGEGQRVLLLVVAGRDGGAEGEVGAGVEGRVDVDEVDLAGELGQQRRQDVLLVALDEAVAPGLLLSGVLEQAALALLGGFVDRLDGLERQGDPQRGHALAVGVILAFSDEFGLAGHRSLVLPQRRLRGC